MANKIYTGIGSRYTPKHICELFTQIATELSSLEFTLRSGGADGADTAFELGVGTKKEIYLPWDGFNGRHIGPNYIVDDRPGYDTFTEPFVPHWDNCKASHRRLHSRNSQQIFGIELAIPTDFVVCWTENGLLKGGTATALRMAQYYNIPIFNFGNIGKDTLSDLINYVKRNY